MKNNFGVMAFRKDGKKFVTCSSLTKEYVIGYVNILIEEAKRKGKESTYRFIPFEYEKINRKYFL